MNLDTEIFRFFNQTISHPFLDPLMVFFTRKGYLFFILLIFIPFLRERYKVIIPFFLMVLAWGLSDATGNMLKNIFERPRPFTELSGVRLLVGKGRSFSFPSNHAATSFAIMTVFWYFFRYKSVRIISLLIAIIIGISRMYIGVHYPSDVIGGALLGVSVSTSIIFIHNRLKNMYHLDKYSFIFYLISLSLLAGRLFYIAYGPLDLSPDEAHYWEWSRRPDLSYYSKGPLIAYLILITTSIGGNTELAVRFFAPFLLFFSSLFIYKLSVDIYKDTKTATLSGILLQIIPLFSTFGIIMTIDAPLIFFWTLSLLLFYRVMNNQGIFIWIILGVSIGLGMLAKYSMSFFIFSIFVFIILRDRRLLRSSRLYLSMLIALIVFLPVIVWNINHEFVTLRHTMGHAGLYEGWRISPLSFLEFSGSQMAVLTPLFFILLISVIMRTDDRERSFFLSFSLPVLVFFFLKSIHSKVQANWAMIGYPSLLIPLSHYISRGWSSFSRYKKIFYRVALLSLPVFFIMMHLMPFLSLDHRVNPAKRLMGWRELGQKVSEVSREISLNGPYFIFSDRYQISSEIAFYTDGNPVTYCADFGRRMNQYDIWKGFHDLVHYNAIFVTIDDMKSEPILRQIFRKCEKEIFDIERSGRFLNRYFIYKCFDFRGMEKKGFRRF